MAPTLTHKRGIMRSIHTTKQQDHKNNTPYRVIHQHRTKLGNPIRCIILPITSIIASSFVIFAGANTAHAEGGSVSLSVDNSDTVLELTVPSSVDLNLTPSSTNNYIAFGTKSFVVGAGTNNPTGYTLSMTSDTVLTNDAVTMTNHPSNITFDADDHPTIASITSEYTEFNFKNSNDTINKWGYKAPGSSNYSAIPSSEQELRKTEGPGNAITDPNDINAINIGFATKVDASQPAGTYTATLNFVAVTNMQTTRTLSDINNMQDMTMAICGTSEENETKQLKDTRDGKYYWVTKLKDGNCWMTQNLDLGDNGMEDMTLTPADSDVSANWTPNRNTQDHQYKTASGTIDTDGKWNDNYNTVDHSYRPASDVAAGTSGKFGTDTDTYYSPVFMKNGTTMTSYKTEAECIAGGNTQTDCQHWNVGTFYSWRAATAGTGNASVSTVTNVSDSICPKGWHLPSSTDSGEFQALVTAGGITASNITQAPYYFLRAGYYIGYYGAVYNTGGLGYYWSSTSDSTTNYAYFLYFGSTLVLPSNYFNRYNGMGVRCVADS